MVRKGSDEQKIRELYKKLAPEIVADSAKYHIRLDYTIDSLKAVDTVLAALHKEYIELSKDMTEETETGYLGYAEMLGCYMLAVVDKQGTPGRLTVVTDEFGTAYGFTFQSGAFCDFVSWCRKAILNGNSDAVYPKFAFFSRVSR